MIEWLIKSVEATKPAASFCASLSVRRFSFGGYGEQRHLWFLPHMLDCEKRRRVGAVPYTATNPRA